MPERKNILSKVPKIGHSKCSNANMERVRLVRVGESPYSTVPADEINPIPLYIIQGDQSPRFLYCVALNLGVPLAGLALLQLATAQGG